MYHIKRNHIPKEANLDPLMVNGQRVEHALEYFKQSFCSHVNYFLQTVEIQSIRNKIV